MRERKKKNSCRKRYKGQNKKERKKSRFRKTYTERVRNFNEKVTEREMYENDKRKKW